MSAENNCKTFEIFKFSTSPDLRVFKMPSLHSQDFKILLIYIKLYYIVL